MHPIPRTLLVALVTTALLTGCVAPSLGDSAAPKRYRIGYLAGGAAGPSPLRDAFLDGLRERGYVEGHNLEFEYRVAEGRPERLPGLAQELVELKLDAIFASGEPAAEAVLATGREVPLVLAAWDAVAAGLVAQTLNRPGRNVTGITCRSSDLGPKRVQLLKELVPTIGRVAVLWHAPDQTSLSEWEALQVAAPTLAVELVSVPVRDPGQLEPALASAARNSDALAVVGSAFTNNQRKQIVQIAAQHRFPSVYAFAESARDGGLLSYGTNLAGMFRRAASHMDRVLQGGRPADLPVEAPTTYDLIVNRGTAEVLGLTIPPSILQQATEVIQ